MASILDTAGQSERDMRILLKLFSPFPQLSFSRSSFSLTIANFFALFAHHLEWIKFYGVLDGDSKVVMLNKQETI